MELIKKIKEQNLRGFANDNVAEAVTAEDREAMKAKLAVKVGEILDILGIDHKNDHNTQETPKRVAKMWVEELFKGRYQPPPPVKVFPNIEKYDGLLLVGPIEVRTTCAHHLVAIAGVAYVGIVPREKVVGLSKYNRIVDWFARRPQIQEELTRQIAKFIEDELKPLGVAVYIRAQHHCMTHRGVRQNSDTITSVVLGAFREEPSLKAEFIDLVKLNETR